MGLTIEQRSHKSHLGRFGGCLASGEEASNLIPTRNAGKGDCLYYSLASPIPGATHVTLRESIMDYILTHGDDEMSEGYTYRTAIESTGYTLEDYCVWQRKTGEFASPIEIAAFCRQYKKFVPVYTQSPDGSKYLLWWTMGDPSHPVVPLYYKGEHYEAMVENNDDEGWTRARKFGKASKLEVNDGESAGKAMPSRFESLLWDDETDDEEENECAAEVEVGSTPQQVSSVSLACSFRGGMVVDEDSESEINEKESTPAMPSSCTSDHKATEAPPTLTHGDLGTVHFDVLTSIPDAQLSAPICRLTSHASRRARQIARDEKKAQQQSQRTLATPQRPPQAKAGATSSTSRFSTGTPPASALDATSAATGSIPPPSPLVAPGSTPFLPDIRNTALSCPLTTVSLLSTTPCIPHTSLSPRRLDTAPGAAEEDAEWTAMKSPESALMSQTEEDYPGGMDSPTAADESFCAADGILTRRMLSLLEVQSSDLFTGEFQSSDGGNSDAVDDREELALLPYYPFRKPAGFSTSDTGRVDTIIEGVATIKLGDESYSLVASRQTCYSKLPIPLHACLINGTCVPNCQSGCLQRCFDDCADLMVDVSTEAYELKRKACARGVKGSGKTPSIRSGVRKKKNRTKSNDVKVTMRSSPAPSSSTPSLTPSAYSPLGNRIDFLGTSKESRIRKYREFVETNFPKFIEMGMCRGAVAKVVAATKHDLYGSGILLQLGLRKFPTTGNREERGLMPIGTMTGTEAFDCCRHRCAEAHLIMKHPQAKLRAGT